MRVQMTIVVNSRNGVLLCCKINFCSRDSNFIFFSCSFFESDTLNVFAEVLLEREVILVRKLKRNTE